VVIPPPKIPVTLSVNITRNDPGNEGVSTTKVYMDIEIKVSGQLLGVGPVPGKLITVYYDSGPGAGDELGTDITDFSGNYEITASLIDDPGRYKMRARFDGDAKYESGSGNETFKLFLQPVSLSGTIPVGHPEEQFVIFQGYLLNDVPDYIDQGYGISSQTIRLKVDTIQVSTEDTDSEGHYFDWWIWYTVNGYPPGTYTINIVYEGTTIYAPATISGTIKIWDHQYPMPEDVEQNCYGWLICIDPNAIRGGPIYYLLDSANVMPGLTDKSGSFSATLDDKKKEFNGFIQYDMYLFGEDKPFILDQDEFWIGLQRGPENVTAKPSTYTWNPTGGSDGKGAGIYWLMGGYISKRYYERNALGRITAVILGKDYMDVWKDQQFGTDEAPHNYETPTFLDIIANDILNDINIKQEAEYRFTAHPTYWGVTSTTLRINSGYGDTILEVESVTGFTAGDTILIRDEANPIGEYLVVSSITDTILLQQLHLVGSPIEYIYGYDRASATVSCTEGSVSEKWQREFVEDNPFDIMQQICEEAVMEWKIDYLKRVMLYLKSNPPLPTNQNIKYSTNIREVPEIVLGDTDNVITDAIVKDGLPYKKPDPVTLWSMATGYWNEISDWGLRPFDPVITPFPPNSIRQTYTDSSLTIDPDGFPCVNFQYQGPQPAFQIHLGYWLLTAGSPDVSGTQLNVVLRTYRRIKLRWRHSSRDLVTPGSTHYIIELHTPNKATGVVNLNNHFRFRFGEGTQEDLGYSKHDTVNTRDWHEIDLLLPQPDINGDISFIDPDQMKGWQVTGNPDPTNIDWIAFYVELHEADPGYAVSAGKQLANAASAGDQYIELTNPEVIAGYAPGTMTTTRTMQRTIECEIVKGGTTETVHVLMIYPPSAPGTTNVLLNYPLLNNFAATAKLYVKGGKSFSFSQLHFERSFQQSGQEIPTIGPRRYRLYDADELKYQSEADGKIAAVLNMDAHARQWVKIVIDGDPEKEIGTRVKVFLDPHRNMIFQNVAMIIDNIEYLLTDVDLMQTLTLTPVTTSIKPRQLDDFNTIDAANYNLRKIARRGRKSWL